MEASLKSAKLSWAWWTHENILQILSLCNFKQVEKDLNLLFCRQFLISEYPYPIFMIFMGWQGDFRSGKGKYLWQKSLSCWWTTHIHVYYPLQMLLYFRSPPVFWHSPFATSVVLWTTQLLLLTNLNLTWEIVGFEFHCIHSLLCPLLTSSEHFHNPHPFWVHHQLDHCDKATGQFVLGGHSGVSALRCTMIAGSDAQGRDMQTGFLAQLSLKAAALPGDAWASFPQKG